MLSSLKKIFFHRFSELFLLFGGQYLVSVLMYSTTRRQYYILFFKPYAFNYLQGLHILLKLILKDEIYTVTFLSIYICCFLKGNQQTKFTCLSMFVFDTKFLKVTPELRKHTLTTAPEMSTHRAGVHWVIVVQKDMNYLYPILTVGLQKSSFRSTK